MSDSIGARLRQARELRHLTLEQASETTKLRTHYLQALENDDFSSIPSAAQARGFLRIYAQFLELDVAQLLPTAPPQPAPVAVAAPAPKETPASSAPAGIFTALRSRFARGRKPDAAKDLPVPAGTGLPAEQPADASTLASSEAQTARRPKTDSTEVKKNALER